MFQMLNWPSASVPRGAAEVSEAGGQRPRHEDRERDAGRRNEEKLARARDGAGRVLHVELLVIVAPVTSSRLVALPAAAWADWPRTCPSARFAFTGPFDGADRRRSPRCAAARRAARRPRDPGRPRVLAIGLRGRSGAGVAIAVSPLVLLFLPWLPFPVPAVFLIWTGALASLVWIAVAIALSVVAITSGNVLVGATARNPVLAAGAASCLVFSLAAFHASPSIPGGDEPHYLVITQSLLYDGDLKIENNHKRGDYRAYFSGDLAPHVIRRGRNGEMYSIHAPGLPALILPAFAIGGYHGVVVLLILIASAACALAWWLAWRTTGSRSAAWFGWAAVTLSAPFLLESYTVFPDGPGAAIVLTGFWALLARNPSARFNRRARGRCGAIVAALAVARRRRWQRCHGCTRASWCSRRRSAG
jgi:hypothetical protein